NAKRVNCFSGGGGLLTWCQANLVFNATWVGVKHESYVQCDEACFGITARELSQTTFPPPPAFQKVNFDGASKGNQRLSGAGFLIRDADGSLVLVGSFSLMDGSCNEAEAQALLEGLKMA
ncbi:hypothetical protein KI387_023068, partial [Taxus chinensis]